MRNQQVSSSHPIRRTRQLVLAIVCSLLLAMVVLSSGQSIAGSDHDTSVRAASLDKPMSMADIRHLASRTGFGVSQTDVQRFAGLTRREAIDEVMKGFARAPAFPLPEWVHGYSHQYWKKPDLDRQARRQFNQARNREVGMLRQWWVSNMLQSPSPQTERMVLFWHDHFATSYHGLNDQSVLVARQNQLFRELGMGSYRGLLKAMIRDPALLLYLNNNQNKRAKPNENLGRELLELFTLGEGNYSESDVKEAARSLTGYTFGHLADMQFRLEPWNQDKADKTLFGVQGKHDGDDLIDIIMEQPAMTRYMSLKFWHALVSDAAPNKNTLDGFAAQFRQHDFDISSLYRSMLSSTAFWHRDNRVGLIKSPVDLIIGTARALDYPKSDWQQIPGMLAKLGMDLFAPPNVSGWSEGAAYVAPGRLLGRYRYLEDMAKRAARRNPVRRSKTAKATSNGMSSSTSDGSMSMSSNSGDGGMMSSMMIRAADTDTVLQLRMAAENYQGPVEYRVELVNESTTIWSSDTLTLAGGHDTEKYGRIENDSGLAWQSLGFSLDATLFKQATSVVVHFLNDHAGADGDRNLYIAGVQLGDVWIDGSVGRQKSGCEPENSAYSGNLYCAGNLSLDVKAGTVQQAASRESLTYSASGAYLIWANNPKPGKGTRRAHIALADVVTPVGSFDNLSFELTEEKNGQFYLNMDTFDCSPMCLNAWPECAWEQDDYSELKAVSIPLVLDDEEDRTCHYESLSDEVQELFDVLWMSATDLLEEVRHTNRGERRAKPLSAWFRQIPTMTDHLNRSPFASTEHRMIIDAALAPPPARSVALEPPTITHKNLKSIEASLAKDGLSVEELLFPGIDTSEAIEMLGRADWSKLSSAEKISVLSSHPLFQVH